MYQLHRISTSIFLISLFYLLLPLSIQAKPLPAILDFYPICQFEVQEPITVKDLIKNQQREEIDLSTTQLLKNLQEKAQEKNADAVIIISRQLTSFTRIHKHGVKLQFSAALITGCDDLTPDKNKPAPINHLGENIGFSFSSNMAIKMETTIPGREKLNHPVITQDNVSLNKGVYGVKLGDSYQKVIEVLGDPSVEIAIMDNEPVIGYGRDHWFHFQSGQLVKVDTSSAYLSNTSSNLVELRDFFDDRQWKINGKVGFNASLAKVRSALDIYGQDLSNDHLQLENKNQVLILKFWVNTHPFTGEKRYNLGGFTLQSKNYRVSPARSFDNAKEQFKLIETQYKKLTKEQAIDLDELKKNLGDYAVRIILKERQNILIYNLHLLLKTKKNKLTRLHFSEQLIMQAENIKQNTSPWFIAGLYQGQSFAESKKELPTDGYEFENSIEFDTDTHQMVLQYEENNGKKMVDELEILFY